MEIKVMTPVITNLKSTGWMIFGDSVRDSISQYVKNEIVPVMKEAKSDLLLEVDRIYSPSNQEQPGFCIKFIINRDSPSYFKIESDNMMILRAVEEIMREIVISDEDNKSSKLKLDEDNKLSKLKLYELRCIEKAPVHSLPLSTIVIHHNDSIGMHGFIGETVVMSSAGTPVFVKLLDAYALNIPNPEKGNIYISDDLRKKFTYGELVRIISTDLFNSISEPPPPFKLTPPEVELINEMKNDDKKTIKCVNRRLETAIEELPYSTMLISPDDTQLFHTVGQTAIVKGPNGTMMSVAVGTSGNKEVIPDDGYIHLSTDVTNSLNIVNETELQVFYNLDSDNIKKEFPELFECDTTPFTHHYKMRRKVSFIRDGKAIDNKNVIFVDKYDPIVTTEGVAQPIHVNKLNEIPTVSCYFIQSDDRYMMSGCIGVSKYMADMMPLKNGQIVEIDIIVHSDNPIKKHSLDFEKLNPAEYESTSSKGLHIEPEIRNGKLTAFSICKDQSDKREEDTPNETD